VIKAYFDKKNRNHPQQLLAQAPYVPIAPLRMPPPVPEPVDAVQVVQDQN
jgi:hypothetical protein